MVGYHIVLEKPGRKAEDITFDVTMNSSKSTRGEYFTSESDARVVLADWFTNWQYEWLILEDENGDEKAEKKILDGGYVEDGDGNRYYVREFSVPAEDEDSFLNEFDKASITHA